MRKKIYKRSVDSIVKREACHSPVLNLKKFAKRRIKSKVFLLKIKAIKNPRKNFFDELFGSIKDLGKVSFLKNSAMNIAASFLIIGLGWSAIFAIGRTTASFTDTEISIDNTFNAGTLFFSLYHGQDNFVSENKSNDIEPCERVTRTIKIRNEGTIPLYYGVHFEKISGDDDLCAYLELEARLEGKTEYPSGGNSKLSDFKFSSAEALSFIAMDNWQFKISLPGDAPESLKGKTCEFKFVFIGKDNLPIESLEGFSDTKEISSLIVSTEWDNDKNDKDREGCFDNENNDDYDNEEGEEEDNDTNNGNNSFDNGEDDKNNREEYFVENDLDISNASEYDTKEDEGGAGDSEDSKEENNSMLDDNSQDNFVYHDPGETIASEYASGDGD